MLQAEKSRVRFPMRSLDSLQLTSSFQQHYNLGVDLDSNKNEYHESFLGGKGRPALKAAKLTAIYDLTI
jgi:hypothetical protein